MEPLHIGEYRLVARLGRGGMADVFLAVRRGQFGFTKLVVIKRLRDDLALHEHHDENNLELLLLDEARVGARLQHPNIVQTFEAGTEGGLPFMAMEYLDGQPLDRVLSAASRAKAVFPTEIALRIVHDVLSALDYAHTLTDFDGTPLGIVHRDVSPHNIFLTYQGEVKLVDFGVAKHAFSSETDAGIVKGKLTYMAPEQASRHNVDCRADIFAAGVVLWESIAMRRLLAADSPVATLRKLLDEPIPHLRSVRPDVDPNLAEICARALERDPSRRYPSARAMRADLDSVIGAASVTSAELAAYIQRQFASERRARSAQLQRALASDSIVNLGSVTQENTPLTLSGRHSQLYVQSRRPSVTGETPISLSVTREPPSNSASLSMLVLAAGVLLASLAWAGQLAPWTGARATRVAAASGAMPQSQPSAESVLRLCGSNTIGAELAPALVEALLADKGAAGISRHRGLHTDLTSVTATVGDKLVSVEISANGSATAFSGLAEGKCDVGMASRAVEPSEADNLVHSELGNVRGSGSEHVIALDGIAVIVHPSNPLRALDRAMLRDIYTGRITDWALVNGQTGPIRVLSRDGKSGTYDTFKHLVLGKDPLVSSASLFGQNDALADAVASDPAAIGFVGLAAVRAAKALAVSEPGAAPMLPTQFTVATEGYMLSRRLYLYTLPKPRTQWVTELVSFALSRRAQQITRATGFVDLGVTTNPMTCDARCTKSYANNVNRAERISIDFRFRPGSNEPDSRATRDLDRLVTFMHEHQHAKLRLLGFADADGSPQANQSLSQDRARAIANELAMRGVQAAVIKGMGAEMPVASNLTDTGKQRNRRVEAWVEL